MMVALVLVTNCLNYMFEVDLSVMVVGQPRKPDEVEKQVGQATVA